MTAPLPSVVFTREEIQQRIPHRPPFLWLDEVTSLGEKTLQARLRVKPEWELFQGHYPGAPVLPGVMICEAIFQAGAVLIATQAPPQPGQVPVVTRLNDVQFRKVVRPGDTLDIDVELNEQLGQAFYLKGRASVGGKVSVRLEFACTLTSAE